jgi:hypothetical protein
MWQLKIKQSDFITLRRCTPSGEKYPVEFRVREICRRSSTLAVVSDDTDMCLPNDVAEGVWRLDGVHEWLPCKLLKDNLWNFVKYGGKSTGVMQSLMTANLDEQSRATLNRYDLPGFDRVKVEHCSRVLVALGLDQSQMRALKICLEHRIAIVQGPPGTGKTTFAHALVLLLTWLARAVQDTKILVVASGNVAVDNLLDRIRTDKHRYEEAFGKNFYDRPLVMRRYGSNLSTSYENENWRISI